MTDQGTNRRGDRNELLDATEKVVTNVARLGYGLLDLQLRLLPPRSRAHMRSALRELSYGLASLPGEIAEIAGAEVERWAKADDPAPERTTLNIEIADEPDPAEQPTAAAGMTTTGVAITYIEHDPPGRDLEGEYVLISNSTGAPVDLTGWVLSDGEARHIYTFPALTLAPGAELRLWTGHGANSAGDLYWNSGVAIWNNGGDTATLKDAMGATVSVYTYTGGSEAPASL